MLYLTEGSCAITRSLDSQMHTSLRGVGHFLDPFLGGFYHIYVFWYWTHALYLGYTKPAFAALYT
ncbi:hypothetical protein EI94DRAFT_1725887 [Lactarius quietus]|nr:hypothetical protein EI94DRAFT_1725887 [Lactarius quietus]